jgi:hypothetical protein
VLSGVAAGLVVGGVVGGIAGKRRLARGSFQDHSEDTFIAVLLYAPIGAAAGALIGGIVTRPRWASVALRR